MGHVSYEKRDTPVISLFTEIESAAKGEAKFIGFLYAGELAHEYFRGWYIRIDLLS